MDISSELPNDIIIKILIERKVMKQNERYKKQHRECLSNINFIGDYVIDQRYEESIAKSMMAYILDGQAAARGELILEDWELGCQEPWPTDIMEYLLLTKTARNNNHP